MTPSSNSNVAKEVLAYCTSCKIDLNHIVVAMKGDRIAKVQCKTCKKEHTYKAPKGVTEPPTKPAKRASKKASGSTAESATQGTPVEAEWEKLMVTHKNTPLKSYVVKGHFSLGDKINHPSFGEGIISKLIYPNKVEVIFKTDIKIMIHAGPPGQA
jgi:hypothetical protein